MANEPLLTIFSGCPDQEQANLKRMKQLRNTVTSKSASGRVRPEAFIVQISDALSGSMGHICVLKN